MIVPWLVVEPTHLKHISPNGNLPQLGGEPKKLLKHFELPPPRKKRSPKKKPFANDLLWWPTVPHDECPSSPPTTKTPTTISGLEGIIGYSIRWSKKTSYLYPIGSMGRLYIYLHEWLILMVNVCKFIIYGSYRYGTGRFMETFFGPKCMLHVGTYSSPKEYVG